MICALGIILRFSGEEIKNSLMAGGMVLLVIWSLVMEMRTIADVITVTLSCWSFISILWVHVGGRLQ
uniref:Uncharacterized protein n=1 Tax=Rhizophora mucronata TaxID=61149 RepID=A0A2P2JX89_RHIMU